MYLRWRQLGRGTGDLVDSALGEAQESGIGVVVMGEENEPWRLGLGTILPLLDDRVPPGADAAEPYVVCHRQSWNDQARKMFRKLGP